MREYSGADGRSASDSGGGNISSTAEPKMMPPAGSASVLTSIRCERACVESTAAIRHFRVAALHVLRAACDTHAGRVCAQAVYDSATSSAFTARSSKSLLQSPMHIVDAQTGEMRGDFPDIQPSAASAVA